MAERLLIEYKKAIKDLSLVPSDGGRFEIEVNNELFFSKIEERRYPSFDEIKRKIDSL